MNWTIEKLETQLVDGTLTDVVLTGFWRCSSMQDGIYGTFWSSTKFAPPGDDFTPYDQLTQDQVLGWLWTNGVDQKLVESWVQSQIDVQKNPPVVVLPNPWTKQ